jgi:hypothetical protein
MKEFGIKDFKELCDLLIAKRGMPAPDAEAFAHALMDIRESTVEIYDELLPKLMDVCALILAMWRIRFGTYVKPVVMSTITSRTPSWFLEPDH